MFNNLKIKLFLIIKGTRIPFLKEWGWVAFVLSLCFFARAQAASFRQSQNTILRQKINYLSDFKYKRQNILDNTRLKLESLSDPEMIRMLLIQELGLVKEGQVKVIFEESKIP